MLAREGAIVPMYKSDRTNDLSLDQPLEIHVFRGNGRYELYEDDGESKEYRNGKYAITSFTLCERDNTLTLTVTPPEDSHGLLPSAREMVIKFRDIEAEDVTLTLEDKPVTVEIKNAVIKKNTPREELKNELLTRTQGSNTWKSRRFKANENKLPRFLREALSELDHLI